MIPHPDPNQGPFFAARILVREGPLRGRRDQRVWAAQASGIRVYLEGFRVLPYGAPKDDWLSIDADYTRRPRQLAMLQGLHLDAEGADPDEGLIRIPNNNYFGAVFLTQDRARTLRMLVNREGFVPELGFDVLVQLVRTGVDLCTRVRAAAAYARRQKWKEERSGRSKLPGVETRTRHNGDERPGLPDRLSEVAELIHRARLQIGEGDVHAARETAVAAEVEFGAARELVAGIISERALLLDLASVGA